MSAAPIAIDLFCGAGGLSEGLRLAGYRVLGAVELDELACKAYRLNHGSVRLWDSDVRHLSGARMLKELGLGVGELDLLAACPPCQGFSRMRTRNGTRLNRDRRNDLILEVLRLVRSIRPKAVMLENVPGLASDRRYETFIAGLESLGYHVSADILNAVNYNVPQQRRRLMVLASIGARPEFAKPSRARATVRRAIAGVGHQAKSRDPLHKYSLQLSEKVRSLIARVPIDGGSRADLGVADQLDCHRRVEGFYDVYGRMAWDRPAPTITGGCINPSKGRFLHPQADRPITLREAALLQTFPKSYQFPLDRGRYAAAMLIGNALPPEFIRRHAQALKAAIR